MEDSLAIYLHIPFCRAKCTYCAFNTYTKLEHLIPPFVDALVNEIRFVSRNNPYPSVDSVYFGGGTPSQLQIDHFSKLLTELNTQFSINETAETTVEVNPNDVHLSYLIELRQLGINRLSIGMQSADYEELKLFARRHDYDTVVHAVQVARQAGFGNISIDLIYGSPYQTLETWKTTLTQALALKTEHISLYALGLEENTPLYEWVHGGRIPLPDDDLAADMYHFATEMLNKNGYAQYEISNWSLPGYACRHNLQYWRNLPYLGLGPGAHGYANSIRYETILSPQLYIKRLSQPAGDLSFPHTPAVHESIMCTVHHEIVDTLLTNLRLTQEGLNRNLFEERFGVDVLEIYGQLFNKFANSGLLKISPQTIQITEQGRLLSNLIFREIV